MTRIAVLGLGEAGGRIARDLEVAGAEVSGFDPAVADGAPDAQAAVDGCDLVLSLNSALVAHAVAKDALPALREDAIYADLNTSAPALKRGLAELVGPRLVDVALLGPVPVRGLAYAVARARATRQRVRRAIVGPLGMPVEVVSDVAGDAAQRKLLRSVFMKVVATAAVESLAAAERAGERDWLYRRDRGGARPVRFSTASSRARARMRCGASRRWRQPPTCYASSESSRMSLPRAAPFYVT